MYELHSRHTNPEPESIIGSLESRGVKSDGYKDICVTSYHPSWLPVSIGMVLHHYQVKCTFKSLEYHVVTDGNGYTLPVGYPVCVFDYDTEDWTQRISEVPNLL